MWIICLYNYLIKRIYVYPFLIKALRQASAYLLSSTVTIFSIIRDNLKRAPPTGGALFICYISNIY